MLSFLFRLCSKLAENAGSKEAGSSESSFLARTGRSIFTGSSSTNCDTGRGPISGESSISVSVLTMARISSRLQAISLSMLICELMLTQESFVDNVCSPKSQEVVHLVR